ncbi:MAG: thioredoxin-disulfide reductase [Candidatus Micrarchaeota archaeon]
MAAKKSEIYDVIIIGIGPAGLSAGLYAGRRALKTLIIGETLGGQIVLTPEMANYPGIKKISGSELSKIMEEQAKTAGCAVKYEKVGKLELKGEDKKISTDKGEYSAKTVIIATGSSYRNLNVPGEDKFIGRGVSYCATCDAPFFKKKKVAVVGGGESAVVAALYLNDIASEVHIVHRRDDLRASAASLERVKRSKIILDLNKTVEKVEGKDFVEKITLKDVSTNKTSELKIDGLFIEIGKVATTALVKQAGVEVNEKSFIAVNRAQETNLAGVYAAGDCTEHIAQVVTSAGEGATAATQAYYLIKKPKYQTPDYH